MHCWEVMMTSPSMKSSRICVGVGHSKWNFDCPACMFDIVRRTEVASVEIDVFSDSPTPPSHAQSLWF